MKDTDRNRGRTQSVDCQHNVSKVLTQPWKKGQLSTSSTLRDIVILMLTTAGRIFKEQCVKVLSGLGFWDKTPYLS